MAKKTTSGVSDLRSQLKATPIETLQKVIDADDVMSGSMGNEYLNLEDGKTLKIRIFPAHPSDENFYVSKKSYWLSFINSDGEERRGTVLDSKMHGGTKWDIVEEYVKWAKEKYTGDSEKLDAMTGRGRDTLNPSYTWLAYADVMTSDDSELRAKVWEFKKMVRNELNRLAFSEDEGEVIEVDPFTDVDEGLPVMVRYNRNPNRKRGENYYEVSFPKRSVARPLTDDEIEYFMSLKPLSELVYKYGIKDFERAMEGLQNFDEKYEIFLFEDEEWLEHLEEIRAQYDPEESDDEEEQPKKSSRKSTPRKSATRKPVEEPEEDDEEDDSDESEGGDQFDKMDRNELKRYIKRNGLDIAVKRSMTDDDIRELIRELDSEEDNEDEADNVEDDEDDTTGEETDDEDSDDEDSDDEDSDDEEEEQPRSMVSLSDIKKKLAGGKK